MRPKCRQANRAVTELRFFKKTAFNLFEAGYSFARLYEPFFTTAPPFEFFASRFSSSAEYAFIMDAAPRDLKEKYKYNGGDCNCGGVTKNIKEWAFDKIK